MHNDHVTSGSVEALCIAGRLDDLRQEALRFTDGINEKPSIPHSVSSSHQKPVAVESLQPHPTSIPKNNGVWHRRDDTENDSHRLSVYFVGHTNL